VKSLAYLVAFLLALVVIGGPLALGLTFIRTNRRRPTIIKSLLAILFALISILVSLVLIVNVGAFGSKILGFIGLVTGIPAIIRSSRSIRDVR